MMTRPILLLSVVLLWTQVQACTPSAPTPDPVPEPGAARYAEYVPMLRGKTVALVANHTTLVGQTHLLDTLLSMEAEGFRIDRVFSPEHGFRGDRAAGDEVDDTRDPVTGIPLVSLYGSHRKPLPEDLAGLDLVLFDLQDVGTRFYTYISTLHYVMEACAENGVPLVVLDRPNPNGNFVDGPLLDTAFRSFVGMHPIPVVHGLTMGELARMINGEGWLAGGVRCELSVVPCADYNHQIPYTLPVRPSPNLANDHAIRLYPSTCFFEGTVLSEGRGTDMPFEVFGHPDLPGDFRFTPRSIPGVSGNPKFKDVECRGTDLRNVQPPAWDRLFLNWLLDAYAVFPDKDSFFIPYFENLSGTTSLREQIVAGWTEDQIRQSWQPELEAYRVMRDRYLLYP
ncbi:MAG: DUF1343 domain-containing protein [Bacteroidales bacterium]